MNYKDFIAQKQKIDAPSGFADGAEKTFPLSNSGLISLFPFQDAIVRWALRRGRAAIFADTGLGKSMMQSSWAYAVSQYTGGRVLIVAPLCVAAQTVMEAAKLGISVTFLREMPKASPNGIIITNYENLDNFKSAIEAGVFQGIVLDESSILKHETSKTREHIIRVSGTIPYRLSCTATPSPNDFMELGAQAEFLGVMSSVEMLAMFFVHDSGETSKWRLKGHGRDKFWEWLASWAVFIKRPSDLGFSDAGYDLPALEIKHIGIGVDDGSFVSGGIVDRAKVKRDTVEERVKACAELVNGTSGPMLVWCHRNDESDLLASLIPGAVKVSGADSLEAKEEKILGFSSGKYRVLITKPKIAGFGMNWQHCSQMAFVGLSDSFEQIYQAIRRCWRFGQSKPVTVHFVAHAAEGPVLENVKRKEEQAEQMASEMIRFMRQFQERQVRQLTREVSEYRREKASGSGWDLYLGDCVDVARELASDSVDYSIFSPPFASLYTYSNSDRDMGNSKNYEEFWTHFQFLISELYRVMRPGRNISLHCMNLTTTKSRDGEIGIRDFRGDLIRAFKEHGFVYHSEVVVWKDPVVAMQRTKALGLLWKTIQKDSSMSRQGLPDYVVTFRKPGVNTKPIAHTKDEFPVDRWQHYASPVWFDIKQSNTLNGRHATEDQDERHIAPLQLDLIERCLELWSAKGVLVFSPFAGIGSEGFVSLQMGRRFVGSELKGSYFEFAKRNLKIAETAEFQGFTLKVNPREAAVGFHAARSAKTIARDILDNSLNMSLFEQAQEV